MLCSPSSLCAPSPSLLCSPSVLSQSFLNVASCILTSDCNCITSLRFIAAPHTRARVVCTCVSAFLQIEMYFGSASCLQYLPTYLPAVTYRYHRTSGQTCAPRRPHVWQEPSARCASLCLTPPPSPPLTGPTCSAIESNVSQLHLHDGARGPPDGREVAVGWRGVSSGLRPSGHDDLRRGPSLREAMVSRHWRYVLQSVGGDRPFWGARQGLSLSLLYWFERRGLV